MLKLNERYVSERQGKKIAVLLGIKEFKTLLEKVMKYEEMITKKDKDYDTENVTADIIMALKELKAGKGRPIEEFLNEL